MTANRATQTTRRIVILGGGFAGAYCAQKLEKTLRGLDTDVMLIDQHNYFAFNPLLIEAGTGTIEPRHALVSIRKFLTSTRFRMAAPLSVRTDRQTLTYRVLGSDVTETVTYAHLVIALGSVTAWPDIPGLQDYGFGMKNLSDAMALRDRAVHMLEVADAISDPEKRRALLHFVVVGGSYTGVEVAGQFHTFLRQAIRRYPNLQQEECQVTLVQRKDRILPTLDADLADYAAQHLRRQGVTIHLNTSAVKLEDARVQLDSGAWLPTHTVIWCAGIAPNPFLKQLPVPVDARGYILCERDLRVQGCETLWAIGDCAVNPDPEGKPYPATAQHAVRQGQHLAHNLARVMRGDASEPCDIKSPGQLASLGCYRGVAKIYGLKFSGFPAWFLWRTVYLAKMPGWGRSLRVAIDWFMEFFFSLDFVQLGVSTTRGSRPLDHDD